MVQFKVSGIGPIPKFLVPATLLAAITVPLKVSGDAVVVGAPFRWMASGWKSKST